MFANVRTDVGVRSDVLFQHARLLTADATLSTYVLAPAATSHINILFIGLIPKTEREEKETEGSQIRITLIYFVVQLEAERNFRFN